MLDAGGVDDAGHLDLLHVEIPDVVAVGTEVLELVHVDPSLSP
jgi:hypothetical protein